MKRITAYKSEDFRDWLHENHLTEDKVEVVLYKKHTGKTAPSHRELIEEAISYGWIDTTIKRLDDDRFMRRFSRRNESSKWSDNTLRYAAKVVKEGRMSDFGMKMYKEGKMKPTHDDGIPKNPDMPEEIKSALEKNKMAKKNFKQFPPSTTRMLYRWYLSAKTEPTREKRIARILEMAEKGEKNLF